MEVSVGSSKAKFGHASSAGIGIVDHDCRRAGFGEIRSGNTADIPTIANRKQWQDADPGMFRSVKRAGKLVMAHTCSARDVILDDVPKRASDQLGRR